MDQTELLEYLRYLAGCPPDDLHRLRDELVAMVFAVDALLYPEPARTATPR
jgi:hypothetical protein